MELLKRLGLKKQPETQSKVELNDWIIEQKIKDAEFMSKHHQFMLEVEKSKLEANRIMMPSLRKASGHDYKKWLHTYLDAGLKPTHWYDYPSSRWDSWYIANNDFSTVELCGANSINIIVKKGVVIDHSRGVEHNNLFYYDLEHYTNNNYRFVPVFNDCV